MFSEFMYELKQQILTLVSVLKSREFWIYSVIIVVLTAIAGIGIYIAAGFDPLTRGHLGMSFSCRTGQGQLATIIIGGFVFVMACVITLGEVINWIDAVKESRQPGRYPYEVSFWRPLLHMIGTLVLAVAGMAVMTTWCS